MSIPADRPMTWFVTGASRGLGLELVGQLLGSDAHSYAVAKVGALRANVDAARHTASLTDFPSA